MNVPDRALARIGSQAMMRVRLCACCGLRYATGAVCRACLRDAEADPARKRAILLPADFAEFT